MRLLPGADRNGAVLVPGPPRIVRRQALFAGGQAVADRLSLSSRADAVRFEGATRTANLSVASLKRSFAKEYGYQPEGISYSPGRFCVFSSHTDYNGGHVLAAGHTPGTFATAASRNDRILRVTTLNPVEGQPRTLSIDLDQPAPDAPTHSWGDYIEFTAREVEKILARRGQRMRGADLLVGSNIDIGAGVSASAALEAAVGTALLDLHGAPPATVAERIELTRHAQLAEHAAGTPCGYLDQASAILAEDDRLILMSCRNPERPEDITYLDANLPKGVTFLLINTNRPHELRAAETLAGDEPQESEYGKRLKACQRAFGMLKTLPAFQNRQVLCDISSAEIQAHQELLGGVGSSTYRWPLHAVTENERTLEGAELLKAGDVAGFGRLMHASHASSRDLYQITCPELDRIYDSVKDEDGVYGAQVIGGGFGGNILVLLDKKAISRIKKKVSREYTAAFPALKPSFTETAPSGGARVLWRKDESSKEA